MFVAVLERDRSLLGAFVKFITGLNVLDAAIVTQQRFALPGVLAAERPDIVITAHCLAQKRHCIFIESKLESTEGDEQLNRYSKLLEEHVAADSKMLVYVTKHPEGKKEITLGHGVQFRQLRWYEIYAFIMSLQGIETANPLLRELSVYMREMKMTFQITIAELLAGVIHAQARATYWEILDQAWERSKIHKFFDDRKKLEGKWLTSELDDGDINYFSPSLPKAKLLLVFGFHFDMTSPGQLGLDVTGHELPVLYVALSHWEDRTSAINAHGEFYRSLSKRGWLDGNTLNLQSRQVVIRKQAPVSLAPPGALGDYLANALTEMLDDLSDAPFFT
ncbi:MAG TPA: PD-(D/E)XK nuclease family protein [Burkholderiales bacterium]|nr:PD-(D/E)XK nuclease family protein [Burkholderiales bacterium]